MSVTLFAARVVVDPDDPQEAWGVTPAIALDIVRRAGGEGGKEFVTTFEWNGPVIPEDEAILDAASSALYGIFGDAGEQGAPDLGDEVSRLCQDHPRTTAETLLRVSSILGATDTWSGADTLNQIADVLDAAGLFPAKVGTEDGVGYWVGIANQFATARS